MGAYLNPTNKGFRDTLNSDIYVDKTGMIAYTNKKVDTEQKYICVSRPRRFGKSIAAKMLAAYYSRDCDSNELFEHLQISKDATYEKYLNNYDVLFLNMQEFLSDTGNVADMLVLLKKLLLWDLLNAYPDYNYFDKNDLIRTLQNIFQETNKPFIIIIDEWDCIFREYRDNKEAQEKYLDFLRAFLKDKSFLALAYMTGILPIKKYGTHSALNMFDEFSMTDPRQLAEYVGFTETEVAALCEKYQMDFDETKRWYDGYQFLDAPSVYSPRSVVTAMLSKHFNGYWNQTESFEALKIYIEMNFDGLKDTIIELLASGRKKINIGKFTNDMTTFIDYNDILTLLIHLGYLGYDFKRGEVFIPNKEITDEYVNAIEGAGWTKVIDSIAASDKLLKATLNQEEDVVAAGIAMVHQNTSHLTYSDENALSYTVSLAYYSARQYYTIIRELPSGKGFADLVFLPRKAHIDKPAMIVELKWDHSAQGAIAQIKQKQYVEALTDYKGNLLLVGINYRKKTKKHECLIEKYIM
ncbi:ATP-binding protein [Lachnospiraceae bacterium ZAX-1]